MRFLTLLFLIFPLFAETQNQPQSPLQGTQHLQGSIQFVNTETTSVMVRYKNMSEEFFILPQTQMSSNGKEISFQNLRANQIIQIEFESANNRNELISLNIKSPIVQNPIKPKKESVSFSGKIISVEPFARYLVVNGQSRMYNITASYATKVTKNGKEAQFMDLEVGQTVSIVAQKQNQQLYPISIDIK